MCLRGDYRQRGGSRTSGESAVGMTVCQLAKIKGARAVGIAGSDEKNNYRRDELGVDAVISNHPLRVLRQLDRA